MWDKIKEAARQADEWRQSIPPGTPIHPDPRINAAATAASAAIDAIKAAVDAWNELKNELGQ